MGGIEQSAGWGAGFLLTLLPSLALYAFLTWSVVRFFKRREALYVLLALAPFAWWGLALVAGSNAKAAAEKEHAAAKVVAAPTELPDTIVFEGKAAFPKPADIRKYFGFRYAIYVRDRAKRGEPPRIVMHKYDLRNPRAIKPDVVQGLPERYVVFRAKDASAYWNDGEVKAADGGPFEMHYVEKARDDLIGLYYHRFVAVPMFPPVLSLDGWTPAANTLSGKDLRALMLEFMAGSLRPA
jgi:hypothetical protein